MNFELTFSPCSEDIDFLTKKINEESKNSQSDGAYPFAFFMRDGDGAIIAGCNGSIIYGVIYTDQLWVHPEYRSQSYGRALMEKVHSLGKEKGCGLATVSTIDFQNARSFYECLGYVVDFERRGYAQNSSCLFLKKKL